VTVGLDNSKNYGGGITNSAYMNATLEYATYLDIIETLYLHIKYSAS